RPHLCLCAPPAPADTYPLSLHDALPISPRPEPYTPADVDAAIARTHLALELINSRYAEPDAAEFPEMLADGLVNQGLFIGPEVRSEEHTSELQSRENLVCRLLLEKKNKK